MDRETFWQLAFLQTAAIQFHPANQWQGRVVQIVSDCAMVADEMLNVWEARCQSESVERLSEER